MGLSYYYILIASYFAGLILWWVLSLKFPATLCPENKSIIKKPWLQTGLLIVAAGLILVIGRLYVHGYLLPEFKAGSIRLSECFNQLIIYSPFPLFILVSRQTFTSAWLVSRDWWKRAAIGFALGVIAILVFTFLSEGRPLGYVLLDVFHIQNLHFAVQIFMEDLAIALFLSRFAAALGKKYFVIAVLVVAVLFSAAHIPNNLEPGVPIFRIITNRTLDAALAFAIGYALYRAKDFVWFFPIHFCMDMMQFYSGHPEAG